MFDFQIKLLSSKHTLDTVTPKLQNLSLIMRNCWPCSSILVAISSFKQHIEDGTPNWIGNFVLEHIPRIEHNVGFCSDPSCPNVVFTFFFPDCSEHRYDEESEKSLPKENLRKARREHKFMEHNEKLYRQRINKNSNAGKLV